LPERERLLVTSEREVNEILNPDDRQIVTVDNFVKSPFCWLRAHLRLWA